MQSAMSKMYANSGQLYLGVNWASGDCVLRKGKSADGSKGNGADGNLQRLYRFKCIKTQRPNDVG